MASSAAQFQVSEPRLYTSRAILVVWAYGLIGIIPVIALFLEVSLLGYKLSALLISLTVIALILWVLPLVSGNPYVARLVKKLDSQIPDSPDRFIVQLTLSPRLRTDLRALAEDADDVGYLLADNSRVSFHGDSIKLSIPFAEITRVQRKYRGLRSLFVPRIVLTVPGPIGSLEFCERAAALLPASRRTSNRIYELLSSRIAAAKPK
jgi:hypothetical protein